MGEFEVGDVVVHQLNHVREMLVIKIDKKRQFPICCRWNTGEGFGCDWFTENEITAMENTLADEEAF